MSIEINHLSFTYDPGLVFEKIALDDVQMTIPDAGITGIIGHSGSGKSTLIQHFNGLILPKGKQTILVDGVDLFSNEGSLLWLRRKVGLVFQYPETQLFEETVKKELAFGPKNAGVSEQEMEPLLRTTLNLVGLDYDAYIDRSPFMLSGGEKRKVAIADILVMKPAYLILDEPTAGLDPIARRELLENIVRIQKQENMSIVVVSHDMEEVAEIAQYIYVMNQGKIVLKGTALEVFTQVKTLTDLHLDVPEIVHILKNLHELDSAVSVFHLDVPGAIKEILHFIERRKHAV